MLSRNVLYYGKDEPLPEQIPLRAGPLSLIYEDGDLRYVKLGDKEILRRIYVAIRDRNWGTVLPKIFNLQVDASQDSFRISYDVDPVRQFYDPTVRPHHHFYNMDTGELIDIEPDRISLQFDGSFPPGMEQRGVDVVIRIGAKGSKR